MAIVIAGMTVSVDGFVADPAGSVDVTANEWTTDGTPSANIEWPSAKVWPAKTGMRQMRIALPAEPMRICRVLY